MASCHALFTMNISNIFPNVASDSSVVTVISSISPKVKVFVFEDNSGLYVRHTHKYGAVCVFIPDISDELEIAKLLAMSQDPTAYTTAKLIVNNIKVSK